MCACRGEREGKIRSKGCNKREKCWSAAIVQESRRSARHVLAALLVCFTRGAKSLDNLVRGNNTKWRGRFIRMSSRGSVRADREKCLLEQQIPRREK